ncbi:adp-ribosylation factor-like protein 2 [Quercus suber]|uniref:Adp-ribosylation factor-like protein 2 n=1 Tax=Quercus suber TaxID=58331 RepID=A0AAW0K5U5_QUESU
MSSVYKHIYAGYLYVGHEFNSLLSLEAMDKIRHWQIVGCSAYTGEGLLEGFDWLVQDVASRIYVLD